MLPLQLPPLDQLPNLNQLAFVADGVLEGQQVADNIPVAQPGQLNLEVQLGMVLVPPIGLHVERESKFPDSLAGLPSDYASQAWARFFAPHSRSPAQPVIQVPVQWADFFTAMLLSPQNFNLTKDFLSSKMWTLISHSEE